MEKRAVEDVPSSQLRLVDNTLRVVALDWKVDTTDADKHLDAKGSIHGAQVPLAAWAGDKYWLIAGKHCAARAIITGAPAFRLQAFEVHEDW